MTAHYIDITPTWEGLLPALLAIFESGEKQYAWTELERMARAADAAVAMNKATKPEARR
jgi:hypothetical protein